MKVGDRVRVKKGSYKDYPVTSRYNLPRCEGTIAEGGSTYQYMMVVFDNGNISPPVAPNEFELVEEKKMAKFKAGDFVTSEGWSRKEGHEIVKIEDGYYYLGSYGNYAWPYRIDVWDDKLFLVKGVSPKSPIVEETVTVKKIAAGDYGNLTIYYRGCVKPKVDALRIEMTTSVHTPEQMRDMAKTLVEIADFIDGGGK
jgi:hypothetical protein